MSMRVIGIVKPTLEHFARSGRVNQLNRLGSVTHLKYCYVELFSNFESFPSIIQNEHTHSFCVIKYKLKIEL